MLIDLDNVRHVTIAGTHKDSMLISYETLALVLDKLTDTQAGTWLKAIAQYEITGTLDAETKKAVKSDPFIDILFSTCTAEVDRYAKAWKKKAEANYITALKRELRKTGLSDEEIAEEIKERLTNVHEC